MKKTFIAIMVMVAASVGAAAQPGRDKGNYDQKQAKGQKKDQPASNGRTLDKAPPAPRPGEGFLIRGREGSAMDAGRPKQGAQADWDLWRK